MTTQCFPLGHRVDATSYSDAVEMILDWARRGESRYVVAAPVATLMEAHDTAELRNVLAHSDLTTPDGMPVVWALRLLGAPHASRVYGPDLTLAVIAAAERENVAVGFYGSSETAILRIRDFVCRNYPRARLAYAFSPPFRTPTPEEDARFVEQINSSGTKILFVGTGSPRQELWMRSHRGPVRAVMVGVGAAFDYIAGLKKQAPLWMQSRGLEWLFRLAQEPRRLLVRNLKHNPRYAILLALQVLGLRSFDRCPGLRP